MIEMPRLLLKPSKAFKLLKAVRYAYDLAFGLRFWQILELEFDQHNSTAGRSNDNTGLDAIYLGFVLPF